MYKISGLINVRLAALADDDKPLAVVKTSLYNHLLQDIQTARNLEEVKHIHRMAGSKISSE